jgi:hypothetical protein
MNVVLCLLFLVAVLLIFRTANTRSLVSGSGGLSPTGGERNNIMEQVELSDRNIEYPTYDTPLYDNSGIPGRMVWDIGHWSLS